MRKYFFILLSCLSIIIPVFAQKGNEVPGMNFLEKSNKYKEKKDYKDALLYINKAIKKDSTNALYYFNRSMILWNLHELDKAILDAQKAIYIAPEESDFNNGLAMLYQNRNRPEDSTLIADYYNESLKLADTNPFNYLNRGTFLRKHNKFKEALSDFYKAQQLDPSIPAVYYEIAVTKAFGLQYYSDAIANFDKAIELKPNEAEYYRARGECFYKMGDINKSTKDSEKAFVLAPNNSGVLLLKASLYEVRGKLQESSKLLDYIISKDTLAWEAYNNRGIIKLFWLKEYKSGIADLKKASNLNPYATMIHNNIGLGYSTLGQYQEAINEFDKAIKEMPELAYAYNNRGYAKFQIKDIDGAFADILQSIKLDPSNSFAFRNRALIYIELKKTEDACLDLIRARALKFETFYGTEVEELISKHCSK